VYVGVGPRECLVGELAVLTDAQVYDHDALCVRDCEVVNVSVEAFQRIVALFPKVLKKLSDSVAKKHMQVGWGTHVFPPCFCPYLPSYLPPSLPTPTPVY
jgi:hypothetical protein